MRGPKSAPVEGDHELFSFLTTDANAIVAPIHPKAMPVILTTPEEVDLWLAAEARTAKTAVGKHASHCRAWREGGWRLSITRANRHAEATVGTGRRVSRWPGLTKALAGNFRCSGLLKSSTIF